MYHPTRGGVRGGRDRKSSSFSFLGFHYLLLCCLFLFNLSFIGEILWKILQSIMISIQLLEIFQNYLSLILNFTYLILIPEANALLDLSWFWYLSSDVLLVFWDSKETLI